jgi:hypothetical protein
MVSITAWNPFFNKREGKYRKRGTGKEKLKFLLI